MILLPEEATLLLPFRSLEGKFLRVGIVVERASNWVDALMVHLSRIPGLHAQLLDAPVPAAHGTKPLLTDRLYQASRARLDPFESLTPNLPALGSIENAGCDVLIWLASTAGVSTPLTTIARYGVFTVQFGNGREAIPFWNEVAHCETVSATAILWHDSSFSQGRRVRDAETRTSHGLYVTINAEGPVIAAIRMLAAVCMEIQETASTRKFLSIESIPIPHTKPLPPTNFQSAKFIAGKLVRSISRRLGNRGAAVQWFIALRRNSTGSIVDPNKIDLHDFIDLPIPAGTKDMADPFLHEAGGRTWLFFEEVPIAPLNGRIPGLEKGRLAVMEVFDDGTFSSMKIILDRDYHLSYPCVLEADGELFLLPECAETGRIDLYRFSRFPWEVEFVSTLFEGLPLVDTTPYFSDGIWYFFATTVDPFLETFLFYSDSIDGRWHLHPKSPVSGSVRNSRSAGNLFREGGRLFRPTQDCSVAYGYAMQMNEVTRLSPTEFEECPVNWISPAWHPGLVATHTWNQYGPLQVIDGRRTVAAT